MKVIIVENYAEMSKKAAEIIQNQIREKEDSVLGLATGSTPEGMYEELVKMYENNELDFSKVTTFNLDEYLGLDSDNDQSYRYYMNNQLFDKINIKKENTNVPDGISEDVEKTANDYDEKLEKIGGTDIQVLGIGGNGHIAFNEPSDSFVGQTHRVDLTKETIEDNSRFFENYEDVPKEAITMGMKSILSAKKIILLASGKNKAEAIVNSLQGPIIPKVPASILQLHNDLVVIIDKDAGSKLK